MEAEQTMNPMMKDLSRLCFDFPVRIPIPILPVMLVKPMVEINMADISSERFMFIAFDGRNRKGMVSEIPNMKAENVIETQFGEGTDDLQQNVSISDKTDCFSGNINTNLPHVIKIHVTNFCTR
jgi:hypothetical protein